MTIQSQTLRPGILVSLRSSVRGNVSYVTRDLGGEKMKDGMAVARWETVRTTTDPQEHERAKKARDEAGRCVRSVCIQSAFGLLCKADAEEDLMEGIRKAREVAEEFNQTATLSRVSVHVITGKIAADDVEAVKSISSEMRELLDEMNSGVKNLDVKSIRDAATRMKNVGAMLSPEMEARVKMAVDAARAAATKIVKAGESAALEIDRSALRRITECRGMFLDMSGDSDSVVAAPKARGRGVDMTSDDKPAAAKKVAAASRKLAV